LDENPSRYSDYNWFSENVPARKFYRFIAEIGRRLRHLMTEPGPIEMIDLCEKCAEGQITEDELGDVADEHRPSYSGESNASNWANNLYWWVADRCKVNTRSVYHAAEVFALHAAVEAEILSPRAGYEEIQAVRERPSFAAVRERTQLEWGTLVRDIYGPNPFLPASFDPSWRTSTALALASSMYESRDFAGMPVLADALEEAGCESADVLAHCRGPGPHVRGCWVVDLVLGKS
jgi:hypothetical protein